MSAYYNEFDPHAAQWLRKLIARGLIAPGDVDDRSIKDVHPLDLLGYEQCHFFAGIGGWSLALRLAGWPDARPVWTGSCPCQPFSAAGKQKAFDDERHLWPDFFRLIRVTRPGVVFGEQVASGAAWSWLDLVSADLEGEGYAVGAVDMPACSVGAPHRRQRLWWVADDSMGRRGRRAGEALPEPRAVERPERCGHAGWVAGLLGDSDNARLEGRRDDAGEHAGQLAVGPASPWRDLEWLPCSDGKARPTQPGLFPLAHGIPNRVGRLRAYGNAIVPQVAAEVIRAYMACRP